MLKNVILLVLFCLATGCASNYYLNDQKELDDTQKKNRSEELEQALKKVKVGDAVTLLLYNGDTVDGTFYSSMDGIVSLRIGDAFIDTELSDVRGIGVKSEDRMKKIMIGLMSATIVGIIISFVVTH